MTAYKTTAPTGNVYWAVLGTPDYAGTFSGYNPADLSGIAIDYQIDVPVNGNGGVVAPGLAGGDLSGTFPDPSVIRIQGTSVSATAPTSGQSLQYNGSSWAPANSSSVVSGAAVSGDLSGTLPSPSVVKIQGRTIAATVPNLGNLFTWTGSQWQPFNAPALRVDLFGADPTGVSDSTGAIVAAHSALPSGGGILVFTDGGTYKITSLAFTKPVWMQFGQGGLTQSSGATNPLISTNSNLRISGQNNNQTTLTLASGQTGIYIQSPFVDRGGNNYTGPSFILEDVGFNGGAKHVDSVDSAGFSEGNFHFERCVFQGATVMSINIHLSFYYGYITRCHWYNNYQSIYVGEATETKFQHNVYIPGPGGNLSSAMVTLAGVAHVVMRDEEFYGWINTTGPDLLIYAQNSGADGICDIENCKFGGEIDYTFNTTRHKVIINAPSGSTVETFSVRFRSNRFYGPAAMQVTQFARSSNVATATIAPSFGNAEMNIGDQFFILFQPTPSAALGAFQGGPFTATAITPTTVSWANTGSNITISNPGSFIFSQSVSAIQIVTPLARCSFEDNLFQSYPIAVDDSTGTTNGLLDSGGRCTWNFSNKMVNLGIPCREFKSGGRNFTVMEPTNSSPLSRITPYPRINETNELRNRITSDSENLTHWGNSGGAMVVTTGQNDPFGTTRACRVSRPGVSNSITNSYPSYGTNECLVTAVNTNNLHNAGNNDGYNGFIQFWAQTGSPVDGYNSVGCLTVALFNNFNDNLVVQTVTLSSSWKRYRLPFIYDPTVNSGTTGIVLIPGTNDAMTGGCNIFGVQIDDFGGDYIPVVYSGADNSVVNAGAGNRWEKEIIASGGIGGLSTTSLGGGSTPALGTIGGSGPTSAAQNAWVKMIDASGNPFWVPIWR